MWDTIVGWASSAEGVHQTSDGGYIIAGCTEFQSHALLLKTDSVGNELWHKTFGGANGNCVFSVQQTSDGGYIITGRTYSYGFGKSDAWLIKVAPA